jgi:hypothetical protein
MSGSGLGEIHFADSNGYIAASLLAAADGAWGAGGNDYPGRLVFSTTADGASSPTERMRIGSNGNISIATTAYASARLNIGGYTNGDRYGVFMQPTADGATPIAFHNAAGTPVGYVGTNASSTTYATSSDYRLKDNVNPITGAADRLMLLNPCNFNFLSDPANPVDGFLAHEAQEVVPNAVMGVKDEVDAEGAPVYQSIDHSKMVPLLTAALQEALGKIAALEVRIAALEA